MRYLYNSNQPPVVYPEERADIRDTNEKSRTEYNIDKTDQKKRKHKITDRTNYKEDNTITVL